MTDAETKFVPFAVSVKLPPPAVVDVGLILVNVGTGFFAVSVGCVVILVNVPASEIRDVVVAVEVPVVEGAVTPLVPPPEP